MTESFSLYSDCKTPGSANTRKTGGCVVEANRYINTMMNEAQSCSVNRIPPR